MTFTAVGYPSPLGWDFPAASGPRAGVTRTAKQNKVLLFLPALYEVFGIPTAQTAGCALPQFSLGLYRRLGP
jgi:hypothetical protein